MAALDVFKAIGSQVDADFLAIDVLPILWQFSLGPLLNLTQFQAYMLLIKSLSARVENEQTRKLQELGASNAPATSRNEFMSFGNVPGTNGLDTNGTGDGDFEALVRGNQGASTGSDMLGGDPWANAPTSASSATLPSRPLTNRAASARNASPAATFSWSSPPVSPPPTNLAAPHATGRTITPDNTMSSLNSAFPAMAPANPGIGGSSFTQPQQSTAPSYDTQSAGIDWTKAAGASTLTSNPWGGQTAGTMTSSGLSNFSIAPPPSQSQPQQHQSNPYSAFSIAPPPPKPATSSFGIAPPSSTGSSSYSIAPPPSTGVRMASAGSGMNMNAMASRMVQGQNQNQQKQVSNQNWSSGGGSLI